MATLLENEPRLRFLQTIRNPIDCAYSIGRNGLAPRMGLERSASMERYWIVYWRRSAAISERVGQATGARLCGLLKATSPRKRTSWSPSGGC